MQFDFYGDAAGESLLLAARERERGANRGVLTEAAAAGLYSAAAVAILVLAPPGRPLVLSALACSALLYVLAFRVRFPVGSATTYPTQILFVPMLFLLPLRLLPIVIAICTLLRAFPPRRPLGLAPTRVFRDIADCSYCLGPIGVLLLAGEPTFSWSLAPLLVAAFLAQVLLDAGSGFARTWFAEGIGPSAQPQMAWLYLTDGCLSCLGLLAAVAAVHHPALLLLTLPPMALLGLLARDRQERLEGTLQLSSAYRGTAQLLGDVVEADDHYTGQHSRDVVELSLAVGRSLGLDLEALRNLEFGALLHDVGKIRVPKEIINKPGKLDDQEWEIMRRHTIEGELMLRQVGGALSEVGRVVRSSHERYDGGGYPDGLAGEAIPLEARIVAACDSYNAMTTDRPYRKSLGQSAALAELERCAGSQFDPRVVRSLIAVLTDEPLLEPKAAAAGAASPLARPQRASRGSRTRARRDTHARV